MEAAEGGGSLSFPLLVDEVAARAVGTVAGNPVFLAMLGFVFVVSHNILLKLKQNFFI